MDKISYLESFFIPPENIVAGHTFCDIPIPITFDVSRKYIWGGNPYRHLTIYIWKDSIFWT